MAESAPLCVIPARGDSPDLPKKNIKPIDGKPLVAHTIDTAVECSAIDDVFVSTESNRIAQIARERGAKVPFMRPEHLTRKDVSLGPVIEHAAETIAETVETVEVNDTTPILVLQPNVPFRRSEYIDRALREYRQIDQDTLISVVQESEFFWHENGNRMDPVLLSREKLRDNFEPVYKETGAITITTLDRLKRGKWTGNSPGYIVTDKLSSFRVNKLVDFWLAERIASGLDIVFRVDGGNDLGLGKVYRAITLATEIEELFNCEITFVTHTSYPSGTEFIRTHDYPVRQVTDEHDDLQTLEGIDPDIVFVDIEDASADYYESLHSVSAAIVNFENLDLKHADFVLNPQRSVEGTETHNNLNGPDYLVLREEFKEVTPEISEQVSKVLITFGGTDPLGMTISCLRELGSADLPFNYKVVLGPGFDKEEQLDQLPDGILAQFDIYRNVSNMAELMEWADIAVSGGGRTVYELAATGTPSIVIAQNDGEVERMKLLREQGAIEFLGHGETVRPNDVADRLADLADDPEQRSFLSRRGQEIVDGQGIQRILNLIEEITIEG